MAQECKISLDGLGMDEKAMLELTNRLNEKDDRKWVFTRGHGYGQMLNPLYCNQAENTARNAFC